MGLVIDGFVILLYFSVITAVGLRMGRRDRSLRDFALGGRSVPWWAVMASVIAAETSAATFLGAPGEGYEKRSLAYVQLVIGVILGRLIVANLFLKPYYTYRVYTVYDYLGVRFGPRTKSYVSALFLLMRTIASGTRLFIPSLVMVLAWRLFTGGSVSFGPQSVNTVWPYITMIVVLTIFTCVYTAKGGIKAVIWTDVIQASLMFAAALVSIGTLLHQIGGIGAVARYVPAMSTLQGYFVSGFEANSIAEWKTAHHLSSMGAWDYVKLILGSEYTLFSALIGATFINLAAFGTDQDMVQRLLTSETHQKARRSLMTAAFMDIPIASAFTFIGILLFAFYQQHPDLKPSANADVFASYILGVMPVGIRGLVLAGVFATAMGSFSAALNALATSATNDWYIPRFPGGGDALYIRAARWFTILFAVLMVLVASGFAAAKIADPSTRIIPTVLGIASYILGPMLGVFLIGMLSRSRGSDTGNVIAVSCGLIVTAVMGGLATNVINAALTGIGVGIRVGEPALRVSFTWFAMIGAAVVFAVGVLFRTPSHVLESARNAREEAVSEDDLPMGMRHEPRLEAS